MSAWDEWFEDVWDALVAQVLAASADFTNKVFYGRKHDVDQFPSVYVCPLEATSIPYTMQLEDLWEPTFKIYVVDENADTKAGAIEVWAYAGKIIERLKLDRTLGGLLNTLQVTTVEDSPDGLGAGLEQHWVALTVTCRRKL